MLAKITREPALILGVATSGMSLAVLFGLDLSAEQMAGVGVFLGAVIALLRFLTTPAAEVVAQVKPDGTVVAGDASTAQTGSPLPVTATDAVVATVKSELVGEDGAVNWMAIAALAAVGILFALVFGVHISVR